MFEEAVCLYMEWDFWMTFTVWVDLVSAYVSSVTVYTVLLLCTDMDLKWIFYKCCKISLAWKWHRVLSMWLCRTSVSAFICIQSSTCFVCVVSLLSCLPPVFLCLCLTVWAAYKGVCVCWVYLNVACVWQSVVLSRSSAMTLCLAQICLIRTLFFVAHGLNLASCCSQPIIMQRWQEVVFFCMWNMHN